MSILDWNIWLHCAALRCTELQFHKLCCPPFWPAFWVIRNFNHDPCHIINWYSLSESIIIVYGHSSLEMSGCSIICCAGLCSGLPAINCWRCARIRVFDVIHNLLLFELHRICNCCNNIFRVQPSKNLNWQYCPSNNDIGLWNSRQ